MKNNFSKNLISLRSVNEIGQIQLAKEIGVSKGTISLWENGLREPTLSNLIALANFFNISLDELVE